MKDKVFLYKITLPLVIGFFFTALSDVLLGAMMGFVVYVLLEFADYAYFTPSEAFILKEAKRLGVPVICREQDNHVMKFSYAKQVLSSGKVITNDEWQGFLPRPIYEGAIAQDETPEPKMEEIKQLKIKYSQSVLPEEQQKIAKQINQIQKKLVSKHVDRRNLIAKIRNLTSSVAFLSGTKVPILFGTEGKAVLSNLPTLAALTYAGEGSYYQVPERTFELDKEENGAQSGYVVFLPVSFNDLKPFVPPTWDENLIVSDEAISEKRGAEIEAERLKTKNPEKTWKWLAVLTIAGVIIMGILAMAK